DRGLHVRGSAALLQTVADLDRQLVRRSPLAHRRRRQCRHPLHRGGVRVHLRADSAVTSHLMGKVSWKAWASAALALAFTAVLVIVAVSLWRQPPVPAQLGTGATGERRLIAGGRD